MASSRNVSYKQRYNRRDGQDDDIKGRLADTKRHPLGSIGVAVKEVNSGMKTRSSSATGKSKTRAKSRDNDDTGNPPPTSRRSKSSLRNRFQLRLDSDDEEEDNEVGGGEEDEEDEEEEEADEEEVGMKLPKKKGKAKAKEEEEKLLHLQVLAFIAMGKKTLQKAGRLTLTPKDVNKLKDAGCWIEHETLAFGKDWSESEMLIWARSFFAKKIEDLRGLKGVKEHANVVSPVMMKVRTIELVPPGVKWNGAYVVKTARHTGKAASVPAGRVALVTCVEVPDYMIDRWTAERTEELRRDGSEDRYSDRHDADDRQAKRNYLSGSDDDDIRRPVKRSRGSSPGDVHNNPVEVSDENSDYGTPIRKASTSSLHCGPRLRQRLHAAAEVPVSPLPRQRAAAAAGPSSARTVSAGPTVIYRVSHYQGMEDNYKVPDPFASSDA